MRKLFVGSLKIHFRDRQAIFWAFAFPLIFITVFGLFDFDRPPTADVTVVDGARSELSAGMIKGMESIELFKVRQDAPDLARALSDLKKGYTSLVVSLPQGFGRDPSAQVSVYYSQRQAQAAQLSVGTLRQLVDEISLRTAGAQRVAVVEASSVETRRRSYFDFLVPGILGMGIMTYTVVGVAGTLAQYRTQRILRRVQATPLAPWKFVVAHTGAFLIIAVVQLLLILGGARALFGSDAINYALLALPVALVGTLVFLNMGVIVGGVTSSANGAQGMANAVIMPMMFLSGTFFPTTALPGVVREAVRFLPLTPLLRLLRAVTLDGAALWSNPGEWALLAVWVALTFGLAARVFRLGD